VTVGHLLLDTSCECAVHAKVNPPIRPREDVEALWQAVLDRKIDWIVSDHACCSAEQKWSKDDPDNIWLAKSGFGGTEYLLALDGAEREAGISLLAMPVIESGAVLYGETRVDELTRLRALLHRDRRRILAVRIGATDLCSLYGLRRSPELSIYDIKVVSALIGDVVNVLGRTDGTGFTVSGPVWEYYGGPERIFKPLLRQSPFDEHGARTLRGELVSRSIDGLIREVLLDKANGLTGKTVIHPGHVGVINALSVVSAEEYRDAHDLVEAGGAAASWRPGTATR